MHLCMVGLATHMVEKDLIKLIKKSLAAHDPIPLKGVIKKRGQNFGFLSFADHT